MTTELLNEAGAPYAPASGTLALLADALDALAARHYDAEHHRMDYGAAAVSAEFRDLQQATGQLSGTDPGELDSVRARVAFWLNVYNALTLHVVLAHRVHDTLQDVPDVFTGPRYRVGGHDVTLDVVEHGILRRNARKYLGVSGILDRRDARSAWMPARIEPSLHFGLYTACMSSPVLQAFRVDSVRGQLAQSARAYLDATIRIDDAGGTILVPRLFKWYAADFGGRDEPILAFVAEHLPHDARHRHIDANGSRLDLVHDAYDWRINDRYAITDMG